MCHLNGVCTALLMKMYNSKSDPMKIYCSKDGVETFSEQTEDEVKQLHATFPQQLVMDLTNVLKIEHEAPEENDIIITTLIIKVRDHVITQVHTEVQLIAIKYGIAIKY